MKASRATALFLSLLLSAATLGCTAQGVAPTDSVAVADAQWQVDTLDGFYLKRYHFGEGSLFGAAQHLFLLEIPAGSERRLAFACDSSLTTVSAFGRQANAYAAVNGSFFDMTKGNPICYLRVDGTERGENTPGKAGMTNRKYYQHAVLSLADGRPWLTVPDSNRHWELSMPDSNIMTAGPMLLRDGMEVPQRTDRTFVTHRHNRTALGIKPDGTTVILVADGRFSRTAEGLTLPELEKVMRWIGCSDAINLDGGGSSTMYIHKEGVVNYPSDNHKHDHEGERPVSNAIIVL